MPLKTADYIGIVEQLERDGNLTASAFKAIIADRTRGGRRFGSKTGTGGLNGRSNGAIADAMRRAIGIRAGWTCSYCLADLMTAPWHTIHLDHAVALANGGTNDAANMLLACGGCNGQKADSPLTPEEFAAIKCEPSRLDEALTLIERQRNTPITKGSELMRRGAEFESARRAARATNPKETIARAA